MNRILLLLLVLLGAEPAQAALSTWTAWATAQPNTSRQIPPYAMVARGAGTNAYYVLEVDPTTGELPVSLSGASISIDYSGSTGSAVPAKAAFVGGTDGTNLRGIKTDSSGELQVDVLSSTLPSGAATSAKQPALGTAGSASADVITVQGVASMTPLQVADSSGALTVDGTVATSNFPSTVDTNTGAAGSSTPRVVLATRHEAVATPLAAQLSNGSAALAYDSGTSSSATLRTVLATRHESASTPVSVRISNGSAFTTPSPAGRAYADSVRNAYASTAVTTGAWVQLIASTAATINALTVFDSCGQTLELGTGAAASETRVALIPPGGFDGQISLAIASGTRVSLRAVSGNCSTGEFTMTGFN